MNKHWIWKYWWTFLGFHGRDCSNSTLSDFDRIRSKSDGTVTNLNKISQPCRWKEHDPPKHKYPSTTTQCQNPVAHHKNITETHNKIPSAIFFNSFFLWPLEGKTPLRRLWKNEMNWLVIREKIFKRYSWKQYFVILYWNSHSLYQNIILYKFHIKLLIFIIKPHFKSYLL